MGKDDLMKKLLVSSVLCFGALTGLAGAAVFFNPTLMDNWIGPAILAAPPAIGIIFCFMARSWCDKITPSMDTGKSVEPAPREETAVEKVAQPTEEIQIGTETASPLSEAMVKNDFNRQIAKSPNHQIPHAPEITVVQTLGVLQREGRLIDFLQEDIEPYDDAQIGAAVREVHRGCRSALKEVFGLSPVLNAAEGSHVEIEEDFDPTRIKLIGNLSGNPPFKGTLRHCGWRFTEVRLPVWTAKDKTDVLAPAEVEIL